MYGKPSLRVDLGLSRANTVRDLRSSNRHVVRRFRLLLPGAEQLSAARGPKRLADFDLDAAPTVNPATIATLATNGYITAGDPVVLLGDSGTGKSHLLIGLGHAACEQGLRVRYVSTAQLVNELTEGPT